MKLALIAIGLLMRPSPIAPMLRQPGNHSVTLTWVDLVNPVGTTYNVYRGAGGCAIYPAWPGCSDVGCGSSLALAPFLLPLAQGVVGRKYVDTAVVAGGAYCYAVSAVDVDGESVLTNGVSAYIPHSGKSIVTVRTAAPAQ